MQRFRGRRRLWRPRRSVVLVLVLLLLIWVKEGVGSSGGGRCERMVMMAVMAVAFGVVGWRVATGAAVDVPSVHVVHHNANRHKAIGYYSLLLRWVDDYETIWDDEKRKGIEYNCNLQFCFTWRRTVIWLCCCWRWRDRCCCWPSPADDPLNLLMINEWMN